MSERGRGWRRMSRGIMTAGVGLFLLLTTTGALPWSFWLRLLPLWPVALIAIGLRLVFERSRVPGGVLLSPALVLGAMAWVAVADAAPGRLGEPGTSLRAERPEEATAWTLEGTIVGGSLEVAGPPPAEGLLVSGSVRVGDDVRAEFRPGVGRLPRVRLRERGRDRIVRPWRARSEWRLQVARDLPLAVDLELVAGEAALDLAAVPVSGVDIEGAFGEVDLRLGRPEKEVTLRMESAFSTTTLQVPAGVPVRITGDSFLSWTDSARRGSGPGYRVHLDGAFNRIRIEEAAPGR